MPHSAITTHACRSIKITLLSCLIGVQAMAAPQDPPSQDELLRELETLRQRNEMLQKELATQRQQIDRMAMLVERARLTPLTPEAFRDLVRRMDDDDFQTRAESMQQLRTTMIRQIWWMAEYEDGSPEVRQRMRQLLGEMAVMAQLLPLATEATAHERNLLLGLIELETEWLIDLLDPAADNIERASRTIPEHHREAASLVWTAALKNEMSEDRQTRLVRTAPSPFSPALRRGLLEVIEQFDETRLDTVIRTGRMQQTDFLPFVILDRLAIEQDPTLIEATLTLLRNSSTRWQYWMEPMIVNRLVHEPVERVLKPLLDTAEHVSSTHGSRTTGLNNIRIRPGDNTMINVAIVLGMSLRELNVHEHEQQIGQTRLVVRGFTDDREREEAFSRIREAAKAKLAELNPDRSGDDG